MKKLSLFIGAIAIVYYGGQALFLSSWYPVVFFGDWDMHLRLAAINKTVAFCSMPDRNAFEVCYESKYPQVLAELRK